MNLYIIIFLIAFIFIIVVLSFITKKYYKRFSVSKIEKINYLISEKKYDLAIKKLKDTLNNVNDEKSISKLHELLGDCYYNIENYSFAVVEYNKSMSGGLKDDKKLLFLARALFKIGRSEEALAQYMSILKRNPDNADIYVEIGVIYYDNLQYEIAYTYFDKAIAIDAKNINALKYKGICAVNMGKYEEAVSALVVAVRKESKESVLHYNLARAYKGRKDYQNALLQYKISVKDTEYATKSLYESAICYIAIGDMGNAINELEAAYKLDEHDKELNLNILYVLADCYEKIRNINKAIEMWENIVIIDQNYKDVNEKLNKYIESKYSDNVKNFFNSKDKELIDKSLKLVLAMSLSPYSVKVTDVGYIIVFAREGVGVHAPLRIIYIRTSLSPVFNDEIIKIFEYSKSANILKSFFVTCAMISPDSIRYAAMSHIDIVGMKKLEDLLQKAILLSAPANIAKTEEKLNW